MTTVLAHRPVRSRRSLRVAVGRAVPAFAMAMAGAALLAAPKDAYAGARSKSSHLIETGSVYAPRAFSELCERSPEICAAEKVADQTGAMADAMARMFGDGALRFDPPTLTKDRLETLKRVNAAVNATIRPREDRGKDHWELTWRSGDCEEYVLMKREMLARLGWPRSALRITVVRDSQGYHAILVAETDQGGFVLDNMVSHITTVADSPYEFVVAQSVHSPGQWVRVSKS